MKFRLTSPFVVFFLILIFLAFSWPGEKNRQAASSVKNSSGAGEPNSAKSSPNSILSNTPTNSENLAIYRPPIQLPPPPVLPLERSSQLDITVMQRQLQDLMRLNSSLKASYASQATEIERIRQEALIHQRILKTANIQIPHMISVPTVLSNPRPAPANNHSLSKKDASD